MSKERPEYQVYKLGHGSHHPLPNPFLVGQIPYDKMELVVEPEEVKPVVKKQTIFEEIKDFLKRR